MPRPVIKGKKALMRIVVTMAGPGAHGTPVVKLDTTIAALVSEVLLCGGLKDFDFEDSDTGTYVRICVSLPKG